MRIHGLITVTMCAMSVGWMSHANGGLETLNELRTILQLPEAEMLEPGELNTLLGEISQGRTQGWDYLEPALVRAYKQVPDGPFRRIWVLRYGNPELIDAVVDIYIAEATGSATFEGDGPPSGETHIALATVAQSTFDPRLLEVELALGNPDGHPHWGKLRIPFLAAVDPAPIIQALFTVEAGERLGEDAHHSGFYCPDSGAPFMRITDALHFFRWVYEIDPGHALEYRDEVLGFVESHALHYARPWPQYNGELRVSTGPDLRTRRAALEVLQRYGTEHDAQLVETIAAASFPADRIIDSNQEAIDELREVLAPKTLAIVRGE